MKKLSAVLLVASLVAFVGCNKSPPGGPGAANTTSSHRDVAVNDTGRSTNHPSVPAAIGGPKDTFKISAPTITTHLKQGEEKKIDITLDRGSEFKQDVTLSFTTSDKGLTITPAQHTIKASDEPRLSVTLAASKLAAIGDDMITVTGKPQTGTETSVQFKVSVAKGS